MFSQSLTRKAIGNTWRRVDKCRLSTPARQMASSKKTDNAGILFFGSLCLVTASLGVWQVNRYNWKVDLIEETKRRANQPPVDIRGDFASHSSLNDNKEELTGRRLVVEGSFDHSREVLMGPRSAPAGLFGPAAQGLATNPLGFFVITPFKLSSGKEIFVNRGWVTKAATNWHRPQGVVSFTAILTEPEPASTFSPVNDVKNKKLFWLEKAALLAASDTNSEGEVIIMDAVGEDVSQAPREGPFPKPLSIIHEHYVQPITHLTYAITWFSLTAFGTIMTYKKFKPRGIRR